MSVKRNDADRERATMEGAWAWWRDATFGKDVVIDVQVERTGQTGVFSFTMVALDLNGPEPPYKIAKVTRSYPNSGKGCFGDFFLGLTMSIGRMVDEYLLDTPGNTRTPG